MTKEAVTSVPTVEQLIRDRMQRPAAEAEDGFKLGLAVEGGGLRGIVSAAMLLALKEMGVLPAFDVAYGTSAGSINLAYVLSDQDWEGLSIYYDQLAVLGFVDKKRPLRGRPVVDMELLRNDIMARRVRLDVAKVLKAPLPLKIAVSNISQKRGEVRGPFDDEAEFLEYLYAGAHLPVLAGPPVEINGDLYLDGGVYYASPYYVAMEDGCTHILALGTRNQAPFSSALKTWQRYAGHQLNRITPGAGNVYINEIKRYYADRGVVGFGESELRGVKIYRLSPGPSSHKVTRLTTDRAVLLDGARVGYTTAYSALGEPTGSPIFRVIYF